MSITARPITIIIILKKTTEGDRNDWKDRATNTCCSKETTTKTTEKRKKTTTKTIITSIKTIKFDNQEKYPCFFQLSTT